MLRGLPEGSRYVAIMSAPDEASDGPAEKPPVDPELEAMLDRQQWNPDRVLAAQTINALHDLLRYSVQWEKGKEPKFPIVGPAEWRNESKKTSSKPKKTVLDVLRMMG